MNAQDSFQADQKPFKKRIKRRAMYQTFFANYGKDRDKAHKLYYNKDGQDVDACIPIGSMIMEESYIKDGKKMPHTLTEVQNIIKQFNETLGEAGLRDINGKKDKSMNFTMRQYVRSLHKNNMI